MKTVAKGKPGRKARALTTLQVNFVREYVIDRNGAAAARRAGYSEKTAARIAFRLLQMPKIKSLIAKRVEKIDTEADAATVLDATAVLQRLSAEATSEDVPPSTRVRALEILARHHGLLIERSEVGQPGEFARLTDSEVDDEIMMIMSIGPDDEPN